MVQNVQPITGDYCRNTKDRLIFHPESVEEAQFVAEQFLRLGFRYYSEGYRDQMNVAAAEGSIYLDTDKTIMVTGGRRADGVLCSSDQFEQFFIADNHMGQGRIPAEEFSQRHMVFYPKTLSEARGVLSVLKSGGLEIESSGEGFSVPVTRAAMQGIAVHEGIIRFAPTPDDLRCAEICSAADIGVFARAALSAEQVTMVAVFNDMAARMEQMAQRIAQLEQEILPQDIPKTPAGGKPAVRRPR
ncbi:MAG: hypothetical protein Q8K65_10505 [Alphaproteobacteria bacterium]|nr:hypothetical protein [Alphaproteobacteria bacterium]